MVLKSQKKLKFEKIRHKSIGSRVKNVFPYHIIDKTDKN
jgi:hypothetical protein